MNCRRLSVALPLILGCISGLLMIWDLHNDNVIVSMGMAWDTGPPVWPYEVSWIAQVSLNAPAYVLSWPVFLALHLQVAPQRYPVFFPMTIIWWWWVGRRLEFGLLPSRPLRHRWWIGVALMVAASSLYCVGVMAILDYARFWRDYHGIGMRLLRTGGPLLWCFAVALVLTIAAFRVVCLRHLTQRAASRPLNVR